MGVNHIDKVASFLNVVMGEEFKVKGRNQTYKFTTAGLLETGHLLPVYDDFMLKELIRGSEVIEKLPFNPEGEQDYFTYSRSWDWKIKSYKWKGSSNDFMRKKCGMVFRTYEEAELARPKIYEDLTGKKWEDNKAGERRELK